MTGKRQDKQDAQAERQARLAAALKENLHKRKAQARARDVPDTAEPPSAGREGPAGSGGTDEPA